MINIRSSSVSIAGAFTELIINVWLAGLYVGYDRGLNDVTGFSITGESGNEFMARCYLGICLLLIVFIAGGFNGSWRLLRVIRLVALALIIVIYQYVYMQKNFYLANMQKMTEILKIGIPFDLISFILIVALIIGQVVIMLGLFRLKD